MAEDCYDFDPNIDELFDTALQVFNRWDKDSIMSQENLLKMLHVYILPKVKFSRKYADQIKKVLDSIEVCHEDVEDKIQKKDMTKKNTEMSLKKQRERILKNEDFSRTSYIATLSEKFLKVFLQHLEKDIHKMNEEFVQHESEVDQLRGSFKKRERKKLTENRNMRDSIYEELQKSIGAREEIKNVVSRKNFKKAKKKSKRHSTHTVFHEVYMEVAARLQNMNKEIQNFINVKIRLSSVREAVMLSLKELELDGETFGYNRKKGSFEIEADLYDPHNKPEEWATLEERVKVFLKVKQAGFRQKFDKFCSTILDKCQRLFDDSKLFTFKLAESSESLSPPISPNTAKTLDLIGSVSIKRRSRQVSTVPADSQRTFVQTRLNMATTYTSRWSFGTIPRESCEKICQDVIEHIWEIALQLAAEIKHDQGEVPHSFVCKVYICYEEHVSSKLMPMLNELYEQSYRENCKSLSHWIERTPLADFGFGDHVVANVLNIVSSGSSSENSSREASSDIEVAILEEVVNKNPNSQFTNSLSNKSVKDMTLEQLYSYCDEQSEALPPLYYGMIDHSGTVNGTSSSDENADQNETQRKELYTVSDSSGNGLISNGVEIAMECKTNDSHVTVADIEAGSDENETQEYAIGSNTDLKNTPSLQVTLRQKQQQNPTAATNNLQVPVTVQQFCDHFKDFERFIEEESEACTLFKKLRILTHALKYIELQISSLRKDRGVCSDDLLDIIIMLLCHIKPDMLLKLYSQLNLLLHLRPNFMEGSAHDYALITFSGAFQHLVEQKMLSKGATSASN